MALLLVIVYTHEHLIRRTVDWARFGFHTRRYKYTHTVSERKVKTDLFPVGILDKHESLLL